MDKREKLNRETDSLACAQELNDAARNVSARSRFSFFKNKDRIKQNRARRGFAIAPILYLLGLIGVGAGILFSGYSQILRSSVQMTNDMTTKSDIQSIGTTLAASSVLSASGLPNLLCPPGGAGASAHCTSATNYPVSVLQAPQASNMPANYANANSAGTPLEWGVFKPAVGYKQLDPYGHYYIYCRWEQGASDSTDPAIVVISAGPDGKLDSTCGSTTAVNDDTLIYLTAVQAEQRAAIWQVKADTHSSSEAVFGQTGTQLIIDSMGNLTVPGTTSISGATQVSNTLQVTGVTTLNSALNGVSGAFTGAVSATGGFSGSVSGATGTFSGLVTATGGLKVGSTNQMTVDTSGNTATSGTLSAGATTLASNTVTGAETIGTTLGVTGNTTLGGTLGVTGLSTLNSASITNALTANGAFAAKSTAAFGSTGQFGLDASGNATTSGTVAITNATATAFTVKGKSNFGSTGQATIDASGNIATSGTLSAGTTTLGATTLSGALGGTSAVFSGTVSAANFSGGSYNGTVSGSNITGTVAIANGGTGSTTASAALTALGGNNASNLNTGTVAVSLFPTSGVTAGVYNWGTVDAYGRVTAANNVNVSTLTDGSGDSVTPSTANGGTITFTNANSTAMTINGGNVGIGTTAPNAKLDVNGNIRIESAGVAAGTTTPNQLQLMTGATSERWGITTDGTAESGTAVGSNFALQSYNNSGVALATPLTINRLTNNASFVGQVSASQFNGSGAGLTNIPAGSISGSGGTGFTTTLGTSASATSPQISGSPSSGFYTAGAGLVDVAIAGTKVAEWSSTGQSIPTLGLTVGGSTSLASTTTGTLWAKADSNATIEVSNAAGSANYLKIAGNGSVDTTVPSIMSNGSDLHINAATTGGTNAIYLNYDVNAQTNITANSTQTAANFTGVSIGGTQNVANTGNYVAENIGNSYTATTGTIPNFTGLYAQPGNGSTGTITNLVGVNASPSNAGGTVTTMWGVSAVPGNTTGTVGTIYGVYGEPYNGGSGPTTNMYAIVGQPVKNSTGTVGTMYGLYSQCQNNNATGAVTNCYGAYLDTPVTIGAITNKFGIYQADVNSKNYFASSMGIGIASPARKLVVSNAGGEGFEVGPGNANGADTSGQVTTFYYNRNTSAWITNLQSASSYVLEVSGAVGSGITINTIGNVGINTASPSAGAALDLGSNTTVANSSILFPGGTTANRPTVGLNGMMRYNTDLGVYEAYQQNAWQQILTNKGGGSTIFLGTAVGAANPQVSGHAGTGFYTPDGANQVAVTNNGIESMQWNTITNGVDYLTVTPGLSGTPPTIAVAGTTSGQNLTLSTKGNLYATTTAAASGLGISGPGTGSMYLFTDETAGAWNALVQANDNLLLYKGSATDSTTSGGLVIAPWSASSIGLRMDTSGQVGIGTASPGAFLDVERTDAGTTTVTGAKIGLTDSSTGTATNITKWPLQVSYTKSGAGSQAQYESGPLYLAGNVSAGTLGSLFGVESREQVTGGTVTNVTNFMASADYGGGGGTVTNRYGLNVADFGRAVTNQYGIYVNSQISGTALNYDIYAAGTALNYFGGAVGIGTVGPSDKLQVVGGGVTAQSMNAIGSPAIYTSTGGVEGYFTGGVGYLNAYSNGSGGAANLALNSNGGSVGIGNASPSYNLDVTGSGRFTTNLTVGGTITATGGITGPGALSGGTTNYVPLWTSATALGNSVIYQSGSSVGIGTTSPAYKLEINGTVGLDSYMTMNRNAIYLAGPGDLNHAIGNGLETYNSTTDGETFFFTQFLDLYAHGVKGASALFINGTTGNVGIGTTSPGSPLTVVGNSSNTSTSYFATSIAGNQTTANTQAYYALNLVPQYTAASGNTLAFLYSMQSNPINSNTGTVTTMDGILSIPQNTSTGTVTNMYGDQAQPQNNAGGTVTNMVAIQGQPYNNSSGTVSSMFGVVGQPVKGSTGVVTTMYGLYSQCQNNNATGAVTTCYNEYLDAPITTGTITNKYGLYQVDANSKNYFAGNVGIGTTAPNVKLGIVNNVYTAPLGSSYGQYQLALYDGGNAASVYGLGVENNNMGFNSGGGYKFYQVGGATPIMVIGGASSINVGIGTASPAAKLHVVGTSGNTAFYVQGAAGNLYIDYTGGGGNYLDGGADYFRTYAGAIYNYFSPTSNYISGSLGLGTVTSPTTLLDMAGAMTMRGMGAPVVAPAGQGRMYFDSSSNLFMISQNGSAYAPFSGVSGGTTNYVPLWSGASTLTSSVIYQSGSSVGIGTTGPGATLQVAGSAIINTTLGVGGVSPGAGLYSNAGTANSLSSGAGFMQIGGTAGNNVVYDYNSIQSRNNGAANALIINAAGGNVGIGTASASSPLTVVGTSALTSGSYIATNIGGTQTTASTGYYYGLNSNPGYNATGTLAGFYAIQANPQNSSTGTITGMHGLFAVPQNASTGTVSNMYGVYAQPQNNAGGAVTTMVGLYGQPYNSGAGTVGTMYGVIAQPIKNSTGPVTTMYSLYSQCQNANATGAVGTCYGLYLDAPITTGAITNRFGVYQVNADYNYFAGNVGIGTTGPSAALSVNGNISFETATTNTTKGIYWYQNANTSWGSIYRNASTGVMYIDSQNGSYALALNANNTSGYVGIGTASPGYTLDVNGNIRSSVALGNSTGFFANDNSGNKIFTLTRQGNDLSITGYAGIGLAANQTGGPSTSYNLYVNTSGNVGIGTASPNGKLEVTSGNGDGIVFYQNADNTQSIQTYIDGHWTDRTTYGGPCCNTLQINTQVGAVNIGNTLNGGGINMNGATTFNSTATFASTATFSGAVTFSGATTFNSSENINGAFTVTDNSTQTAAGVTAVTISGTQSTANTGTYTGLYLNPQYTAASGNTLALQLGIEVNSNNASTGTLTQQEGIYSVPINNGTMVNQMGVYSQPQNSAGTISTMWGVYSQPYQGSSGAVTNMYGVMAQPVKASTGSVTTMTSIYANCQNTNGTGSVGTCYDLYLDTPYVSNGGVITTKYGVYQVDTASNNYFAGSVGIGTTSPVGTLDVKTAANQHIQFVANTNGAFTGYPGLVSINDANSAYEPMGFYASAYSFGNGTVTVTGSEAVGGTLTVTGGTTLSGGATVNGTLNVGAANALYWPSYGGGWYMSDATWIRSYGSKPVYMSSGYDSASPSGAGCGGGLGNGYTFDVCGSALVSTTLYIGSTNARNSETDFFFMSGGVNNWYWYTNGTAGQTLGLAYDNSSGTYVGTAFSVDKTAGAVTFNNNVSVSGTLTATTFAPSSITTGVITITGAYLYMSGGTGTVNSTGGPFLYADASNTVMKIGSGNGGFWIQNYAGTTQIQLTSAGNIILAPTNPSITSGGSYITIPYGAYFSGGTSYFQTSTIFRAGLYNDTAAYLQLSGGTSGYTYVSGSLGIGTTTPMRPLSVANEILEFQTGTTGTVYYNVGDNTGSNGGGYVWVLRGLGSNGTAQVNLNQAFIQANTTYIAGATSIGTTTASYGKLNVATNGTNDGIVFWQDADNSSTIQSYIDGQWSNRTTYSNGCCNDLYIDADNGDGTSIGNVHIGNTRSGSGAMTLVGNSITITGPVTGSSAITFSGNGSFGGALIGNGVATGFYIDASNAAIRTPSSSGTIYFQSASGSTTYGTVASGGFSGTFNGTLNGAATALSSTGDNVYTSGWYRSNGTVGWYNNTYGSGWYMTDSTYVRTYSAFPVLAGGYYLTSDARLKHDIQPFDRKGLDIVDQLRTVHFKWNKDNAQDYGVIAQEVEKVLPEVIQRDAKGLMAVQYDKLVLPVIEAVKELHTMLKDLQAKVAKLLSWQTATDARLDAMQKQIKDLELRNRHLDEQLQKVLDTKAKAHNVKHSAPLNADAPEYVAPAPVSADPATPAQPTP